MKNKGLLWYLGACAAIAMIPDVTGWKPSAAVTVEAEMIMVGTTVAIAMIMAKREAAREAAIAEHKKK